MAAENAVRELEEKGRADGDVREAALLARKEAEAQAAREKAFREEHRQKTETELSKRESKQVCRNTRRPFVTFKGACSEAVVRYFRAF